MLESIGLVRFGLTTLRTSIIAGGLIVLAGCGSVPEVLNYGDPDQTKAAARTFQRSFSNVQRYYVDDVNVRTLAVDSLSSLTSVDDSIKILSKNGQIVVGVAGHELAHFSEPEKDDPEYWGVLTSAAAAVAFEASSDLKRQGWRPLTDHMLSASFNSLDSYSRYSSPTEAAEEQAARDGFGGIGVTLSDDEGRIVIRNVIDESPAAFAGVKEGDLLVAAGGKATTGLSLSDVVTLVRGPVNSPILLQLDREGAAYVAEVKRQHIIPPTVFWHRDENVGVIRITWFNRGTQDGVETAIYDLYDEIGRDEMEGIILDVRGNPGGFLHHAVNIADMFIRSGEIVSVRGRHPAAKEVFRAHADDLLDGRPIVVLIDGNTASASEILASALQDSGRGVLVGTSTYGKGSVQQIFELPNAGEVKVTWARYYAPSGYSLTQYGVYPSLCTAEGEGTVDEIIGNLGRSGSKAARNLKLRRHIKELSPKEQEALAAACPWKADRDDQRDLTVAKKLFNYPGFLDGTLASVSAAPKG